MRWTARSTTSTSWHDRAAHPGIPCLHSKVVAPASDALYRTICEMEIAFPRIPLVGNIDGELYPTHDMDTIKRRLADQMASSVQFVKGVETCYREGARIFVEVGPKRALMALAESILEDKDDVICFSTNHPKRGGCVPSTKPCAASTLRAFPAPKISWLLWQRRSPILSHEPPPRPSKHRSRLLRTEHPRP